MEDTETTAPEETTISQSIETTGNDGNQEADNMVLMSGKPLHRFVQKEPRSLGIVILIFGCAELLMGFHLTTETLNTSYKIYIPFWLGALFVVCGILSIYTELHPSKKMVTVCLALYVVSLLGIIVSVAYRIFCFGTNSFFMSGRQYYWPSSSRPDWAFYGMVTSVESIMFISSLCVSALLIFLSTVARFALKSTHTQVTVRHISAPQSDTTTNQD